MIAFGRGGARETVVGLPHDEATGLFFAEQSPTAIAAAVRAFDREAESFSVEACVANAERFGHARFAREFHAHVAQLAAKRPPGAR